MKIFTNGNDELIVGEGSRTQVVVSIGAVFILCMVQSKPLQLLLLLLVTVGAGIHMCRHVHMEVTGLVRVSSLFPPCGTWDQTRVVRLGGRGLHPLCVSLALGTTF